MVHCVTVFLAILFAMQDLTVNYCVAHNVNAVLTAVPSPRPVLTYKRSSISAQRSPERRHLQRESIHPSGGGRGGLRENE